MIRSSPAIGADGMVYVGSQDGRVYAFGGGLAESAWPCQGHDSRHTGQSQYLGAQTDTLKWIYQPKRNSGNYFEYSSTPAIGQDGTIYIGFGGYHHDELYALNPDGSLKWSSWGGGFPAIGVDDTIYLNTTAGIHALNPDSSLKWSYRKELMEDICSSPAIGANGTIYASSFYDRKVYALNPDGSLRWSYQTLGSISTSPAIGADGTVYFGSHDGKVYALRADGSLKWSYQIPDSLCRKTESSPGEGWVYSSPAIGAEGTVYIGSCDAKVYALNPDEPYSRALQYREPHTMATSEPYSTANRIPWQRVVSIWFPLSTLHILHLHQ